MRKIFFILILVFCVLSCKRNVNTAVCRDISSVVSQWENKEIIFPREIDKSGSLDSLLQSEYKIVAYFDSTGCLECKLSLDEWDVKIKEMKMHNNVSFVFIVQSDKPIIVKSLCKRHWFYYPVFVDEKNLFYTRNHLNNQHKYQVFLLDKDNRIRLIGDPILNSKLWNLYTKMVK